MVATINDRWLSPPANIHPAFQAGQKKAFLTPKDFRRDLLRDSGGDVVRVLPHLPAIILRVEMLDLLPARFARPANKVVRATRWRYVHAGHESCQVGNIGPTLDYIASWS